MSFGLIARLMLLHVTRLRFASSFSLRQQKKNTFYQKTKKKHRKERGKRFRRRNDSNWTAIGEERTGTDRNSSTSRRRRRRSRENGEEREDGTGKGSGKAAQPEDPAVQGKGALLQEPAEEGSGIGHRGQRHRRHHRAGRRGRPPRLPRPSFAFPSHQFVSSFYIAFAFCLALQFARCK